MPSHGRGRQCARSRDDGSVESIARRVHEGVVCARRGGRFRHGAAEDYRGSHRWRLRGVGRRGPSGRGSPGHTYFERSFPRAEIRVTTDLEIALEAAFGGGEEILLL